MFKKLSLKITTLFALLILVYLFSIVFITMPKIKEYVYDSELRNIKAELQRVAFMIDTKAKVLETFSKITLDNHKKRIEDIAKVGKNIINSYYEKYKNGEISLQEAKTKVFLELDKIKYGENDYFYTLDKNGFIVQHPDKRFLGIDLYNTADKKGDYFARNLMKNAKEKSFSYTKYWWVRENKSVFLEKLAYSFYFEPWDIYVSTGLYIDDIQKEISRQKESIILELKTILSKLKIEETGYIFVTSKTKDFTIHEKNRKEFENIKLIKNRLKEDNSLVHMDYEKDGFKYIICIEYNKYFDWYIIANVKNDELHLISKSINNTIFSISFLVLTILFIFGLYFIKKLIHPIEILSKNALEIKNGNLTIRNNIKRDDELGILAKQFNSMVGTIEDNMQNLEDKIFERTQALHQKLYFDDLTKLKNKVSLLEKLKKDATFSLIIIDIEAFDDINELYSYRIGNVVLKEYTKFLEEFANSRSYEVFRLYGNTFALLEEVDLMNMNFEKYEKDIHKIIDSTKEYKVFVDELNLHIDIDVTLGVSIFQENSLSKANQALKFAKKHNKKFFVYSALLDESDKIKEVIKWRENIKDAIEHDKMKPFYQPILNREKKVIKFETLMRMKMLEEGKEKYISPFLFLDIAVRTKQYARLSEIIIRKALQEAKIGTHTISINLSFADIQDSNLLNLLDEYFNESTKDFCKRVVFEILESDHISDYEIFEEFIFKFRKLGIRFAIDDFGTGYSNFTHILAVRPDYIKIDGSLIKNIHEDKDSLEMVKSIVRFCQELHIKTIAEYVHNEEVFDIVYDLGVDEFQGYYFYPPLKEISEAN